MKNKTNVKTIGLMIDWFKSDYQYALIRGIETAAAGKNINWLYFIGTNIVSYDTFHRRHKVLYELIDEKYLDYLIVMPGVVEFQPVAERSSFFEKYKNLPIMTLAFQLDPYPCILLDNQAGFETIVKHLIEFHGKRRPVFIKGPDNSFDADVRFGVFKQVMAENGLPLRNQMIVEGDTFTLDCGIRAGRTLLEQRKLIPGRDFDAVIAANDNLAVGVMSVLLEAGYKIPGDALVSGFDDNELSRCYNVPLTTVRQPVEKFGAAALQRILNGSPAPGGQIHYIPTELVMRESCGCAVLKDKLKNSVTNIRFSLHAGMDLCTDKSVLIAQAARAMDLLPEMKKAQLLVGRLIDAYCELLTNQDEEIFLAAFNRILAVTNDYRIEINTWNYALIVLKRCTENTADVNSALDRAAIAIGVMLKKSGMKERLASEIYLEKLRIFEEAIKISPHWEKLVSVLVDGFKALGITDYFLFFYENPAAYAGGFRLKLSGNGCQDMIYTNFESIYTEFLHQQQGIYCILPLIGSEDVFGFLIMNKLDNEDARIAYEDIASQVSVTLESAKQINDTRLAYSKLETIQKELKQELEVARTIQKALLPGKIVHKEFDIAGRMITAALVGGDYYDFISVGDRDWIVIGDVSGHGVHAGLIMMMVQTSIHLILKEEPAIAPRQLLARINAIITENIKRLGEARFMTILVLAHLCDGTFIYAGMHLPFYIYRQATGKVETVETEGFWLGIMPDISALNHDSAFTLAKGDCLLLYTDGVTEAEDTAKHTLYTDERLAALFARTTHQSAEQVVDAIIADLTGFYCDDDVTLFVLKRL